MQPTLRWNGPRSHEHCWVPAAAWAFICLALAILVLTPLTTHRLILFPPVVVVYLVALEGCWRRWGSRDRGARGEHGAVQGAVR